jgi:DNA-binding FadR family transcriptional regulator
MALHAVDSTTTLSKVADQLTDEVCSGRWQLGSRIPGELTLAAELNVSRPLVREAIRELTRLGLLEPRRGSGTFVRSNVSPAGMLTGIERAEVREIFEVQMAYDVQAAGAAAAHRDEEHLVKLRDLLARRAAAEVRPDAAEEFAREDAAFHLAVVEAAGNPLLLELYRFFVTRLREAIALTHGAGVPICGHRSHEKIVDAIADGDIERAREASRRVVEFALGTISGPELPEGTG